MKVVLFTTILFSGLVAGLMYSYSCSINIGLKELSNTEYIKAMQSINIAIQNPLFFISFIGLLVLFPISIFQFYGQPANSFYLLVLAMVIYFIGVFGVTVFCNIPLNEQLASFSTITATENELSVMREVFEKPWNTFHQIRTVASIISFGFSIIFILKQKC